ncbi:haloacid dehalogenase [Devosia geojensis]|uniref:Haloacid dehalogenase n=1 Tax=Devosia geojensis TaxID=443610 RepID=A0A0F5FRV1_9HYPH|nr:haloacid dehalogenase [Devosia geojensis]
MLDVDGVLVRGRPQDGAHLFTDLERDLGIMVSQLQQEFFKPRWAEIVTGKRPIEPDLSEVLMRIAPNVSAADLMEYWFRNDSRIDQDVLLSVRGLRARGNRVFLATNQEHRRADYLMNEMGLGPEVDGIFYSAALGHRKPSADFYALATDACGSHASSIVLIDDTPDNVVAAREFGWQAIHWQDGMRIGEELARLAV